jgi:hypothetical protein
LLFYIFLKITSVLNNYNTYVYKYNVSKDNLLINILELILDYNPSPIYSIYREENKPFLDYLIKNNVDLTDYNSRTKFKSDDIRKIYGRIAIQNYLRANQSMNVFFNTENMNLNALLKETITEMKCQSKTKKIKLSKTQKHKPLSFEKKRRSFKSATKSITRKSKGNNIASITRKLFKRPVDIPVLNKVDIPTFNKENINIGLLLVTVHGEISIPLQITTIQENPDTKIYYKYFTLPGYYSYMKREENNVRRSANSEDNDYEYVGDSVMSEEPPGYKRYYDITLAHYRNIFERCFKKNPLKFYEIFYSCGNKIINNFLRGEPILREQDKKEIDYSKLNKTTGPGPISKILDKKIELGNDLTHNTKITFIVFNNSSKKFEKYNLSDFSEKNIKIINNNFTTISSSSLSFERLSQVITFVLTYSGGLDSLYVYDTSCGVYSGPEEFSLDEIDRIIEELPPDVGK